jgi:hypothetical protein
VRQTCPPAASGAAAAYTLSALPGLLLVPLLLQEWRQLVCLQLLAQQLSVLLP